MSARRLRAGAIAAGIVLAAVLVIAHGATRPPPLLPRSLVPACGGDSHECAPGLGVTIESTSNDELVAIVRARGRESRLPLARAFVDELGASEATVRAIALDAAGRGQLDVSVSAAIPRQPSPLRDRLAGALPFLFAASGTGAARHDHIQSWTTADGGATWRLAGSRDDVNARFVLLDRALRTPRSTLRFGEAVGDGGVTCEHDAVVSVEDSAGHESLFDPGLGASAWLAVGSAGGAAWGAAEGTCEGPGAEVVFVITDDGGATMRTRTVTKINYNADAGSITLDSSGAGSMILDLDAGTPDDGRWLYRTGDGWRTWSQTRLGAPTGNGR